MVEKLPEQPAWDEGVEFPVFDPLSANAQADVVIIGGGLTGLVAAYFLSDAHYSVVVLEKDRLGHGATGVTTAFLTAYIDTALADLMSMFGEDTAQAVVDSHTQAIDMVERIVRHEQIECGFQRCNNYLYATSASQAKMLEAELAAVQKVRLDLTVSSERLPFATEKLLVLSQQAKFHPLQYLAHLTRILAARGVRICEKTEATKLSHFAKASRDGETYSVATNRGFNVRTKYAVVTTYAPFDQKLFFKKAFYTSYILEAQIPHGVFPEAIYEDTADPYHYWRVDAQGKHDRLIFGGADHRSDVPVDAEKSWQALGEDLKEILGDTPHTLVRRWRGPILETVDGLAYVGAIDTDRVLYATGFSGNGMTYAHIAGQMAADAIAGRPNPWKDVYNASRRPALKALLYKGRDYTKEFFGGAVATTLKQ